MPGWSIVAAEYHVGRTDGLEQSARQTTDGGMRHIGGTDIEGYRVRSISIDDVGKPVGDLDDCIVAANGLVRTVGPSPQALQQSIGMGVDRRQSSALRAGVALEER